MGLIGYLRQKHFGLRFLMVSCIVCSALTGTGVYLRQKAIRRNLQGMTYMSHSLLLLKVLNDTSADGTISDDNVEILESMAYSSALFGMLQGKKFKNEPWIDFLNEMHEYLLLHPRRNDTPVIIELKKMLNDVLYQPAPTLKDWSKKPPLPSYDVSSSSISTGICVKPISPPTTSFAETDPATISSAIASICGSDLATSDRYEARNDALRSIARERNLASNDVAALVSWLASTNDVLRVERLAALKNDVMNLLRNQTSPPPGFADTLISIFESEAHPPAVLDYCIQHLGAIQGDLADESQRRRIHSLLVKAAGRINQPYAGTALYALAEDASATPAQDAELRRLTHALCAPSANPIARIAAIQLAGERGCAEALPLLRKALAAPRRDAVTDIVCIGSLGFLGDADDIPLLRRFATMGPRYATAAETAINRIEKRADDGKQR